MFPLEYVEERISKVVRPKGAEDRKEKAWKAAEWTFGMRRERLTVVSFVLATIYVSAHQLVPFLSYILCVCLPLSEYKQHLNDPQNRGFSQKRLLRFWNLFAVGQFIDYTPLAGLPLYYIVKTAIFLFFALPTTDGATQVGDKIENLLSARSSPQPTLTEQNVAEVIPKEAVDEDKLD